jgi:hypothetical protein
MVDADLILQLGKKRKQPTEFLGPNTFKKFELVVEIFARYANDETRYPGPV